MQGRSACLCFLYAILPRALQVLLFLDNQGPGKVRNPAAHSSQRNPPVSSFLVTVYCVVQGRERGMFLVDRVYYPISSDSNFFTRRYTSLLIVIGWCTSQRRSLNGGCFSGDQACLAWVLCKALCSRVCFLFKWI